MPYATAACACITEEAGKSAIVFVHEFADDLQIGSRRCASSAAAIVALLTTRAATRCRMLKARSMYSQAIATDDIAHVMRHLELTRLTNSRSMGGYATVHFGLRHAKLALSKLRPSASATAPIPTSASSS